MMSNTARGQEVRKYFIAVEKAYISEGLQTQIDQAKAELIANFEKTKKDTIVDFLKTIDITYFGKASEISAERKYFALLELKHLRLHATAFKYNVPVSKLRKWQAEMTSRDMEDLAEVVRYQYPAEAIRWDMEAPERKRLIAQAESDKAHAAQQRKVQKRIAGVKL